MYSKEVRPRSPMDGGIVRMSAVEGCPRREGYTYLRYTPDRVETGRAMAAADDGKIHETDVVARLLERGYKIWNYGEDQITTYYRPKGVIFKGHPDLFIERSERTYGLEVKGYRSEAFDKYTQGAREIDPGIFEITDPLVLTKRPFTLMGQIQMYLHSEAASGYAAEEWILVMKNKNTAELAECVVPKMPEYVDALTKKWRGFWGLMQVKKLPERFFASDTLECKLCSFKGQCWGLMQSLGPEVVEVPSLSKAVEYRRLGKSMRDEADILLDAARLAFEREHAKNEVRRITCDGLTSTISERGRSGLDTAHTKALLSNLLEDDHISQAQYDACKSTTEYLELRFQDRVKRVS